MKRIVFVVALALSGFFATTGTAMADNCSNAQDTQNCNAAINAAAAAAAIAAGAAAAAAGAGLLGGADETAAEPPGEEPSDEPPSDEPPSDEPPAEAPTTEEPPAEEPPSETTGVIIDGQPANQILVNGTPPDQVVHGADGQDYVKPPDLNLPDHVGGMGWNTTTVVDEAGNTVTVVDPNSVVIVYHPPQQAPLTPESPAEAPPEVPEEAPPPEAPPEEPPAPPPPAPPVPPPAPPAPPPPPTIQEIKDALGGSPTGRDAIKYLDDHHVAIVKGPAANGSYWDSVNNQMVIASDQDAQTAALTVAHEANHAHYDKDGLAANVTTATKDDYVNGRINEEAEGTVKSIEAKNETVAAGKPFSGKFPLEDAYNKAYKDAVDKYKLDNPTAPAADADAAGKKAGQDRVVQGFKNGSNEVVSSVPKKDAAGNIVKDAAGNDIHENYTDYYTRDWNGHHPPAATGP